MKDLKISGSSLEVLTLLYLAVPLVIFFAGWLKPVYAFLTIALLLVAGWQLARACLVQPARYRWSSVLFLAGFCLALTAFMGIGGFTPQISDWIQHNPILFDCVNLPWPVVLADGAERWPLGYYLGYYLPAALAGKVTGTGYAGAQVVLWLWTSLGLAMACGWFARLSRLPVVVASPAFFAFSGLTFVANPLVQVMGLAAKQSKYPFYPNEGWSRIWQFPSHFFMLEWAPGQALAGWLSAGMLLSCPKPQRLQAFVFLFICMLLWSPFAGLGLGLLAVFLAWREGVWWPVKPLVFTFGLLLPLGVLMAFYTAKLSPEIAARFPPVSAGWFTRFHFAPGPLLSIVLMLLFFGSQCGVFLWLIRARFGPGTEERNLADAAGLACLCLLPVTMGFYNDLCMRASAVPLFCLALLLARTVTTAGLAPGLRRWCWLVILIGGLTPLIEAAHTGYHLVTWQYDPRVVPHEVSAVVKMPDGNFEWMGAQFVGSTNSFFWRNLAR
jgi:hypothetical protein